MSLDAINRLVAAHCLADGLSETGVPGVRLFRATRALPCVPVVYDPCIVAITQGSKEAILDGNRFVYDSDQYLCCPMSMPVKAGTPAASPEAPLFGVLVSLDTRLMAEIALEMARASPGPPAGAPSQGIRLARWDAGFSEALLRLVSLAGRPADAAVLGSARLRELYYAVLQGDAGPFARQAFGPGNAIARAIAHISADPAKAVSIDDLAARAGMSRAAFHRRFKQATTMTPIQFVKSLRLNTAAMQIATGRPVAQAALDAGYVSASQFSRDFRRVYGQSPRDWSAANQIPFGAG